MPSSLSFLLYNNSDLPLKNHARSNNRGINSYTDSVLERPTKDNANGITQERENFRNRLARHSIVSDNIWRRHNIRNDIKSTKPEPLKMASNENSFLSAKRRREAVSKTRNISCHLSLFRIVFSVLEKISIGPSR